MLPPWHDYDNLLLVWSDLRSKCKSRDLETALHTVNDWWATAPIVSRTIHFDDEENWPSPWDLLAESAYCELGKCLGICYTLLLIEHEEINSLSIVQTDNYNSTEYAVQVNEEYVLSDLIGQITTDDPLHVKRSLDCERLRKRIK